jgi:hypothetical protein
MTTAEDPVCNFDFQVQVRLFWSYHFFNVSLLIVDLSLNSAEFLRKASVFLPEFLRRIVFVEFCLKLSSYHKFRRAPVLHDSEVSGQTLPAQFIV